MDGLRPGPARQIFSDWIAAQAGPLTFSDEGRGPGRPIEFQILWASPGPARPDPSIFTIC